METFRSEKTKVRKCESEDAIRIPKVLDTKVEPLFSLPSDLMSPKGCKRKGEKTLVKERGKMQKFRGGPHTAKRLRGEKFRRFMVGLIMKPELPEKDVDLSDDKDVNRYYYYISNGVDTIHTASIEDVSVEAILHLVPGNLRDKFPDFANDLMLEIKEDFTKNMKKAIVEFALTDPSEEHPSEFDALQEDEPCIQPDSRKRVEHCREILHAELYLINPCMRMTLEQWVRDYSQFRLINLEHIAAHEESWDLMNFFTLITRQIVANRRILKRSWYLGIQEIFLVNNRKKMVPSPLRRKQFKRFFDCAGKLMESQLLRACKRSLRDFINYVAEGKPVACRFKVSIVVVSRDLAFEPSFDKFKESLCDILEAMCDAVRNFERLETQLYLDWAGPQEFLKPQISQPIVEQLKRQINQLIDRERIVPERKMAELRKYAHLYNDEELGRAEAFLRHERRTLEEYEEKIKVYYNLAGMIPIEIERTVFAGFFEVSHAPFVRAVVENVERFKGLLVHHLVDRYQNTTKK